MMLFSYTNHWVNASCPFSSPFLKGTNTGTDYRTDNLMRFLFFSKTLMHRKLSELSGMLSDR